ncbi:MAG: NFACT family protein, partial [Corallococcus sp.]|nr:NFACT family protein [Corallococcus sp.]
MAYDALSLSVLAKEFADTLIGGKITKIYQPEKDEIVLFVFNKRTFKLLISANAGVNRIHITDASFDNPKTAPSFCMLLRKHITNATVTSVCQMPYERVLDFGLSVSDELGYRRDMRLIFELTGKTSNIILTDDNYITLDSIKHLPQDLDGKRLIMSGAKYTFFLPQNKIPPFDYEKVAL